MKLMRSCLSRLLMLIGMLAWLSGPVQAQAPQPALTVSPAALSLSGTPGQTLHVSFTVRAGPEAVDNITVSLAALSAGQPAAVIPAGDISFPVRNFDLPPGVARTVWATIGPLPAITGTYGGALALTYGPDSSGLVSLPLTVTVRRPNIAVEPVGADGWHIRGRANDLSAALRITALDGPLAGLTLSANPLRQSGGGATIAPDQLSLSPAALTLAAGESRLATLTVNGPAQPGAYQGQIYLSQPGQPLAEAITRPLTVTVLATPSLAFPQGTSLSASLVRCSGWLAGPNCWLAGKLLAAGQRQPALVVQAANSAAGPVVIESIQPAIGRVGGGSAGNLLTLPGQPLTIDGYATQDIRLPLAPANAPPGQYKGSLTLFLNNAPAQNSYPPERQSLAVDINVRWGPLTALALILLGIIAGRLLQALNSEQIQLLKRFYEIRAQMAADEAKLPQVDRDRIEADAEALRQRIYQRRLHKLDDTLTAFGRRPGRLLAWHKNKPRIEAAGQPLSADDQRLMRDMFEALRDRIHAGEALNVAAETAAILARSEPLQHLATIKSEIAAEEWPELQRERLLDQVEETRRLVLDGQLEAAEQHYENLVRASHLLAQLFAWQDKLQGALPGLPNAGQRQLLQLLLSLAEEDIFAGQFVSAERWLLQLKLFLIAWGTAEAGGEGPMGDDSGPAASLLGDLAAGVETVRQALHRRIEAVFRPAGKATGAEQPVAIALLSRWQRWQAAGRSFISVLGPELALHLGTPAVWLATVVVVTLIGFETLYIQQGATFGAKPLWDSLTLVLWGLTSDVTGATLDKLFSLRTTRGG